VLGSDGLSPFERGRSNRDALTVSAEAVPPLFKYSLCQKSDSSDTILNPLHRRLTTKVALVPTQKAC
jgi:hypothetical protein